MYLFKWKAECQRETYKEKEGCQPLACSPGGQDWARQQPEVWDLTWSPTWITGVQVRQVYSTAIPSVLQPEQHVCVCLQAYIYINFIHICKYISTLFKRFLFEKPSDTEVGKYKGRKRELFFHLSIPSPNTSNRAGPGQCQESKIPSGCSMWMAETQVLGHYPLSS